MKSLAITIASMLSVVNLFAGVYNVDLDHSSVAFKAKHMMISNVRGQFKKFNGTFEYDEKTKILKGLNGVVDVNSIDTDNKKRDGHLKSADFFDAVNYSEMKLALIKVEDDVAYTKLTIRGITKEVKMELETSGVVVKDPWGNTRTGLSLSTSINRMDFGLKWNDLMETGSMMVGTKIKISIELEGILAK